MKKNENISPIVVEEKYNVVPDKLLGKIGFYLAITIKRIIDIIGAIFGILLMIPITIAIAFINFIYKENGPIFYTQERIGKNGKLFKMYKYRSMIVGADEILDKYLEENKEAKKEYKINKKLKNDPRITRVGKILRKTSLDEFPQFINVLKGDMSLVGPRPYLLKEKEDIGSYYPYIIGVRPGITGLWQVTGRSDVTFEERLELDLEYYKNINIKTYLQILIKTVKKVFKRDGAI